MAKIKNSSMTKKAKKNIDKSEKQLDKQHVELETAEPVKKSKKPDYQKQYDEECRKLNAARAAGSVEAIGMACNNISAIKKEAKAADVIVNISSDESFGVDEPHIRKIVTENGKEAYFVCGDLSFPVDPENLNKVVGCNGETAAIDKLMDSQLMSLARYAGYQIEPFNREMLRDPLIGLVQMIWYRDVESHESDHLKEGQKKRVDDYHRHLQEYKNRPADAPAGSRKSGSRSTSDGSKKIGKIIIPAEHHKKMLEMHKKGESTGAIALALGMERSKASRAAVRSTLRGLESQK